MQNPNQPPQQPPYGQPSQQPPYGAPPPRPPYQQQPPPQQPPYGSAPPPQYGYAPGPQPPYPYQGQPAAAPPAKKFPWWVLLIPVVLVGALIALAVISSLGPASIKSAEMAKGFKDNKAVNSTTTFAPTDNPLHSVVEINNPKKESKLKAVWSVVEAAGQKDILIDETELTLDNKNIADFTLSLPREWPKGKYKVDLYLDGKLDRTLNFTVA